MAKHKQIGGKLVQLTQEELDYWEPIWAANKANTEAGKIAKDKIETDKEEAIVRLVEASKTDANARDTLLAMRLEPSAEAVPIPEK